MTSYTPQTRYAQEPDRWHGSDQYRFATREEAEISLRAITSPHLLETRIIKLPWKATWTIAFDRDGEPYPTERGRPSHRDDLRGKDHGHWRK